MAVILRQQVAGMTYRSPFIVSSSPLTDSVDLIKKAEDHGAGAVSTKLTLLHQPVKGIRQMYAERGLFGFNPSDKRNDLEDGLRLVQKARQATDLIIWANIAGPGGDLDGWVTIAKAFEQAGAHALELNMICPNISLSCATMGQQVAQPQKVGAVVGKDPVLAGQIVRVVKENVAIPIWCKPITDAPDFLGVARSCHESGADGIVINGAVLAAPPIDIYRGGRPRMASLQNCSYGGMCGPAIKPISNRFIGQVAQTVDIPIAGGGGISKWQDVVESVMFGSSLITICTQILWDGFEVLTKLRKGLEAYMQEFEYETLGAFRGMALQYIVPTSELKNISSYANIDMEKCNGCGLCARVGSCTAIQVLNKKAVLEKEKCVGCGLCWSLCKRNAVYFTPCDPVPES